MNSKKKFEFFCVDCQLYFFITYRIFKQQILTLSAKSPAFPQKLIPRKVMKHWAPLNKLLL